MASIALPTPIITGWLAHRTSEVDHIFDCIRPYRYTDEMSDVAKKITANLPASLLERAQQLTGQGITETLITALQELERSHKRSALRALRGRIRIDLDLERTRR